MSAQPNAPQSVRQAMQQATQQQDGSNEQHEHEVEEHEAYQYWGYLFKPDKTGTDKLKGLLSGLKDVMNEHNEPSDTRDLNPKQLAHFYRELHGNYDQLFLETPSESIAFIYKSLGCLHSLQPPDQKEAHGQDVKFVEPTVPALKTEGWIMWQTIQLLLGPEEHSGFMMEAVQKWDVKDPISGETFPKILPRHCFPMEPDEKMVAWYEGVSERLRREAEAEERQRDIEAHQAGVRRILDRKRDPDEEESVDSRSYTMAYFRDPLYRQKDGRPSIVRRNSKRPTLSPRPTMMDKGKGAASTMGHVIRNIGSPHLWDGRHASNSSRSRDRHGRRRSLPENRFHSDEAPTSAGNDNRFSPEHGRYFPHHHHRQPSIQMERPATASTDDTHDTWNSADPESVINTARKHHREDPELRHSRSHEPTPSQKEYGDYFEGYDDPNRRRNSTYSNSTPEAGGPGFAPSASPLFASHIARQPQPAPPPPRMPPPQDGPPRKSPSMRRAQGQDRPYSHSRSPDPSHRHRDRDDRNPRHSSMSRERRRHDRSPNRSSYDNGSGPPPGGHMQPGFPPVGRGPGAPRDPRDIHMAPGGIDRSRDRDRERDRDRDRERDRDRRSSGRMSGSDLSAYSAAEDQRPRREGKQTRFASGVDGRVYPNESGWR